MTTNTFDISNPSVGTSSISDLFATFTETPKFIIVGGRPAVGKTSFGIDAVRSVSLHSNKSSFLFSLESSTYEILNQLISRESKIPLAKIATDTLSAEEESAVAEAKDLIKSSKIVLWHGKEPSLENIQQACVSRKNSAEGLDIVFIDYLQLMSASKGVSANRQEAIATISRGLKILSKELGITVVLFSQLGRDVEYRDDKTPVLSDLRDASALEQDSDMVILLHRPSRYDSTVTNDDTFAIIAKNRAGSTGIYSIPSV